MLILTAIDLYIPEKKWSIVCKSGLDKPDQKPTGGLSKRFLHGYVTLCKNEPYTQLKVRIAERFFNVNVCYSRWHLIYLNLVIAIICNDIVKGNFSNVGTLK